MTKSISVDGRRVRSGFRAAIRCATATLAMLAACLAVSTTALGQSRDFDDWARFKKGSWCELRTTSESLTPQGEVSSLSTSKARVTVVEATSKSVTLEIAAGTVEYEGKKFPAPAVTLVLRPFGQGDREEISVTDVPKENVDVAGASYACRGQKAEISLTEGRRTVVAFYRDGDPTLPIKRVSTLFDAKDETVHTATSEAMALDMPCRVLDDIRTATYVRTVYKNHKLSTTTMSLLCSDVPGRLVLASSKEHDAKGSLQRRTTQELVAYGLPADQTRGTTVRERVKQRREERRTRGADERG